MANGKSKVKAGGSSQTHVDSHDPSSQLPKPPKPPSRPVVPYLRYSSVMWNTVKDTHPQLRFNEIGKIIGAQWRKMTDEEKKPYRDEYSEDKNRFKQEMKDYKNSLEFREYQAMAAKLAGNKKANARLMEHNPLVHQSRIKDESMVLDEIEEENDGIFDVRPDYNKATHDMINVPNLCTQYNPQFNPGQNVYYVQMTPESLELTLAREQRLATTRFVQNEKFMEELFSGDTSAAYRSLLNPKRLKSSWEPTQLLNEKTNAIHEHMKEKETMFKMKQDEFARRHSYFLSQLSSSELTANASISPEDSSFSDDRKSLDNRDTHNTSDNNRHTSIYRMSCDSGTCSDTTRNAGLEQSSIWGSSLDSISPQFAELKSLDISTITNDSGIYEWSSADRFSHSNQPCISQMHYSTPCKRMNCTQYMSSLHQQQQQQQQPIFSAVTPELNNDSQQKMMTLVPVDSNTTSNTLFTNVQIPLPKSEGTRISPLVKSSTEDLIITATTDKESSIPIASNTDCDIDLS